MRGERHIATRVHLLYERGNCGAHKQLPNRGELTRMLRHERRSQYAATLENQPFSSCHDADGNRIRLGL